MQTFGYHLFILLSIVFLSFPLKAEEIGYAEDAQERYDTVSLELNQLKSKTSGSLIRLFEDGDPKQIHSLNSSHKKRRAKYLSFKKEADFWGKVSRLREDLIINYLTFNTHTTESEQQNLKKEANRIAFVLIEGISKLKEGYKINSFPLVHNFFIQVGLKKRGACKHWAEDLLSLINTVSHPHFITYWAEAHAGTMREHNVAVVSGINSPFEEGILIDPWRTAGKPYWDIVKKDNHPWRIWLGYQPR